MKIEPYPNSKGLSINRYERTSDPDEHVGVYVTQMSLYTSDDAILCCVYTELVHVDVYVTQMNNVKLVKLLSIFFYRKL